VTRRRGLTEAALGERYTRTHDEKGGTVYQCRGCGTIVGWPRRAAHAETCVTVTPPEEDEEDSGDPE